MKIKFNILLAISGVAVLAGCSMPPTGMAYWQRVEADSSLWMHGPKAQQELDQNIAACVREVDELVEIGALRQTTPPDTHSEYHRALDASGDLAYYDTPTRYGSHHVSHTDFHDFESCMRTKGWERTNFVRYQTAQQSQKVYKNTQQIRVWGVSGDVAVKKQADKAAEIKGDYKVNQ
jgi:hypothetical protein